MHNNDILNLELRFMTMVIGYKMYYSSRDNNIPIGASYGAYQIIHNRTRFDLSGWLHRQIMENLSKIKKDYNYHVLKFSAILVCIFFYFRREFPGILCHANGTRSNQ